MAPAEFGGAGFCPLGGRGWGREEDRGGKAPSRLKDSCLPFPKPKVTAIIPGPHLRCADWFYSRFPGRKASWPCTPFLLGRRADVRLKGKCLGNRFHFLTATALPQTPLHPPAAPTSPGHQVPRVPGCRLRKQETAVLPLMGLK